MPSLLRKLFHRRRNEDYDLGIALYNEGRFEEAIGCFEAAVAHASSSSTTYRLGIFYAAEAHGNLGRSLLKAGRYAEASEHFTKALAETPTYPDLHYSLGVARFMSDDVQGAVAPFTRALEINSDYVEARCFLAVALHSLGNEEEARGLLADTVERQAEVPVHVSSFLLVHLKERQTVLPEVGPVLELLESSKEFREVYSEGIRQFNLGRYDRAAELLARAATLKPRYADIQCQLGLALLKQGRSGEAVGAFQNALVINPRFMEASYFLGLALLQGQQYREAEEALEFAREFEGEDMDLLYHLAQCKYHLGKTDEVDALLGRVLDQRPDFSQAKYLQGLIRFREGSTTEGIDLLQRALRDDPHLGTAEMDLGLMYFDKGEWETAEDIFQRLSGQDGENTALQCFLGQSHLERGNLEAAIAAFQKALDQEAENLYALGGLLRCELKLGRHAKAQALLTPYLSRHGDYPDLRKLQGDIHFHGGAYSAAEGDYRDALRLAPNYVEAQLGLALTLRNLSRGEEAALILRDLVARHPEEVGLRKLLTESFVDLDV